ncbi:MAG: penicillin acylase family protein [Thermomicrobiales bacterium]
MGNMSRIRTRRVIKAGALGSAAIAGVVAGMRARRERRMEHAHELGGNITISRDELGVPHIVAGSREDALFGFGFAVAEDRLWQMDTNRRAATGRLSEIVGPETLDSDRMMRLLGITRIAHQIVARMTDEERTACERFAAGVNHFIETGPLPLEFRALRYRPEPWEPADSVAVFRLLAWTLSGSPDADLTAERLRNAIGAGWTDVIYRGAFEDHEPIVREHARTDPGSTVPGDRLPIFPQFGASNAWAVSPEHSVTGGALLANDPHLELRNPSIWCEVQVEAPGFRVAGMTVPGIPAIVIGRTPGVAWGVTAAATPQVFLYRETLQDDRRFENDGEWQPLRTHDEFIQVKGQPDETLTIRYTPRGPLYSDINPQPDGQAVSIHWAGMEEGHELDVLLTAAGAMTIQDVLPRIGLFTSPPLNVVAADSSGDIAAMSMGKMAVRSAPPGLLPPGEYPPKYVDPEDMPLEVSPERGWVACANNRLVDSDHSHNIHGNWDPGFRYRRIVEDLTSRNRHSPADFRNLQLDVKSVHAADVVPVFASLLDGAVDQWIVDDLRNWDYRMTAESRPPLIYEAINQEWTRLALRHRLPEDVTDRLIRAGGALGVPVLFVDRVLRGELPAWMEDEDRVHLVTRAAEQAIDWLTERLGPERDDWHWGDLHRLTFTHPLGQLPGPHTLRVNVGPYPVPGSRHTVSPMVWDAGKPFDVMAGPSFRYVTDLKRPDQGWISNTLGQSGSPLSRHFRDQVDDYLQGFMHSLWPKGFPPRHRRTIRPTSR